MDPKDEVRGGVLIGDLPITPIEARDQRAGAVLSPISAIAGSISISAPGEWSAPPAPIATPAREPDPELVLERDPDPELDLDGEMGTDRDADSPTPRTLEVLDACDPRDPRFETIDDPRMPPAQMYFKIGEVAKITGIKPYVLRYWEVEFPWIRPEKTSSRQRRYRRQDVALLLRIGRLRYREELTIDRTRQVIKEDRRAEHAASGRARGGKKRLAASPNTNANSNSNQPKTMPRSNDTAHEVAAALDGVALQLRLGLGGVSEGARLGGPGSAQVARMLAEMRRTVLELLESVEE